MARILKKSTEIVDVKKQIREKIKEHYGSVAEFLKSEKGLQMTTSFGDFRFYLYDTGPVNYKILSELTEFFSMGKLVRSIKIVKTVSYFLSKD